MGERDERRVINCAPRGTHFESGKMGLGRPRTSGSDSVQCACGNAGTGVPAYSDTLGTRPKGLCTAVLSEAWAKLREWAVLASQGQLLLSGSVVLASLKAAVHGQMG